MKSLLEKMGVTYRQEGDYFIPNITLSNDENKPIGVCAFRCVNFGWRAF